MRRGPGLNQTCRNSGARSTSVQKRKKNQSGKRLPRASVFEQKQIRVYHSPESQLPLSAIEGTNSLAKGLGISYNQKLH
ncbi:hypothetical protein K1719_010189 [Acacia pycnantha]|nr:hypothetical protein K1719_010189 [Acacia pycnantha]